MLRAVPITNVQLGDGVLLTHPGLVNICRCRIVILGASGNALDILDVIEALGDGWQAAGILDDARPTGSDFAGLPVLGRLSDAPAIEDVVFINAIASERTHRRKTEIIAATGIAAERFVTLVHPLAAVSRRASLGRGVCVGPGCAISGHVVIGDHGWLGAQVVVGHDTVVGAGATIAPGATLAGGVKLGEQAYVGSGATLRPGISVGDGALIGMGAVVLSDVRAGSIMIGNPARPYDRGEPSGGAGAVPIRSVA
jgi:sugar O-acyltransferase (sialic acid O-acetyltransferase NeuD family)